MLRPIRYSATIWILLKVFKKSSSPLGWAQMHGNILIQRMVAHPIMSSLQALTAVHLVI